MDSPECVAVALPVVVPREGEAPRDEIRATPVVPLPERGHERLRVAACVEIARLPADAVRRGVVERWSAACLIRRVGVPDSLALTHP